MGNAQLLLEGVLVLLLGITLFHAVRLERALGVLKRDRAVLEDLVAGFNESTRQAEAGVERLRAATDGAGRQIARQIEQAQRLRDDLAFLGERGERQAERLEAAVRAARMVGDHAPMGQSHAHNSPPHAPAAVPPYPPAAVPPHAPAAVPPYPPAAVPPHTPAAGPPYAIAGAALQAMTAMAAAPAGPTGPAGRGGMDEDAAPGGGQKLRSEAERDLLRALRAAR
jgi:hypothetical protein